MERQAVIQEVRSNWKRLYTADKKGKGIVCPLCGSGSGTHGTGITADTTHGRPHSLHCWACGFSGDVLDLVQQDQGVDFNGAVEWAADQLGITIDNTQSRTHGRTYPTPKREAEQADLIPEPQEPEALADYSNYYIQAFQKLKDSPEALSYLQARGISQKTAERFLLGYDPEWISPATVKRLEAEGNTWRPPATARIIIPVSDNHYVARAIRPEIKEYAKMNETGGGKVCIFNQTALKKDSPVFITEGVFDALAIEEAGAAALALNSTSNAEKLLQDMQDKLPAAPVVLCLDNDEAGKKAADTLQNGLDRMGVVYILANVSGTRKDPNEALTEEKDAFIQRVKEAVQNVQEAAIYQADTMENWETEAAEEGRLVSGFFRAWKAGETVPAEVWNALIEKTDYAFYEGPADFFRGHGLLEPDKTTPTEYGLRVLSEGTEALAADRGPTTATISAEEWAEKGYYAAEITADPGKAEKARTVTAIGYEEYRQKVDRAEMAPGWKITKQHFLSEADYFPGLLTYDAAVEIFQKADETHIELKSFPEFSKLAKIQAHDSIVLAADTGAGKSSLAINFLNDLNDDFPVLYFNLEMDGLTILRRLVAIRTGIELDQIEGYQKDQQTAETVNAALKAITSRKALQVLQNVYTIEDIEEHIKQATEGRTTPTIVIVDHSLLVTTKAKIGSRYERFTHISEELRRISRQQNVIMFILLQQSREGKKDENEPPKNYSLKESGSWENDATHICFLWYDPAIRRKKLLLTKNRGGESGEILIDYYNHTQTYREAKQQPGSGTATQADAGKKRTNRDKKREKLEAAYQAALRATNGSPTLRDMAEAADVTTATIKTWAREFGGIIINGQQIDPAGIDDNVEYTGFVRLSESEEGNRREAFGETQQTDKPVKRRL